MPLIIPCRGNVYRCEPTGSLTQGSGFFKVAGLPSSFGANGAVLINGVSSNDDDVVLPVITLENKRVLYSFGANFGSISVSGIILLGQAGSLGGGLQTVTAYFDANRVSNSKRAITVTGPSKAWRMFLTGLAVQPADPISHMMPFTLIGNIAQPR